MTILELYLAVIQLESYSSTNTRRTRAQKTRAAAGSIATAMARKKKDAQYKRMMFYKAQYKKQKEQLQRKYKSAALAKARQKAAKYKR